MTHVKIRGCGFSTNEVVARLAARLGVELTIIQSTGFIQDRHTCEVDSEGHHIAYGNHEVVGLYLRNGRA